MSINLVRTADPVSEPVSLAEAKRHLRVIHEDEDSLIRGLIRAAREFCEEWNNRTYLTTTWQDVFSKWPSGREIELQRPPLQSVTSITYRDTDDAEQTLAPSIYTVSTNRTPGVVRLNKNESWPSLSCDHPEPVVVTFVAGGTTRASVNHKVKQAILLLVGHWFMNRESITSRGTTKEVEQGVQALLALDSWGSEV